MSTIHVTLDINRGVKVNKSAIAEIISSSIMGGKAIRIVNNPLCNGADCAGSGDYLKGRTIGMLGSMLPQSEMDSYLEYLKNNLGEVYDSLNAKIRDPNPNNGIGKSIRDLQGSLANLKSTTDQLNGLMLRSSGKIDRTLGNVETLSGSLAANTGQIETILNNASAFSGQLSRMDMQGLMASADTTMESANEAVKRLEKTLATADVAVKNVNLLLEKVKKGDGTIGLLFNDQTLYHNLNKTSMALDTLLTDLQTKPYKYIPLKSRRKIKRYERKDAAESSGK